MSRRPDPGQTAMGGLAFGEPVQSTLDGEDVPHRDVLAQHAEKVAEPDAHPVDTTGGAR